MPLFARVRPDDSLTSSEDAYETPLPRRPRPAATQNSYEERRRSYYASPREESRRREQREREEKREPSRKPLRSASEDRDRRERREARRARDEERELRRQARAAHDPEREALRQERRDRRRASRQAPAARGNAYEVPEHDHRQQRRASRRAERFAPEQEEYESQQCAAISDVRHDEEDGDVGDLDIASHHEPTEPLRTPIDDVHNQYLRTNGDLPQRADQYRGEKHLPAQGRKASHHQRQDTDSRSQQLPRSDSRRSFEDDWMVDLESSSLNEKKHHRSRASVFSELAYYKRHTIPERGGYDRDDWRGCCGFSRRCTVLSLIVVSIILLIIIITVAAVVSKTNKFNYKPSTAQVNNTYAFSSGGATRESVNNTKDGIGAGTDAYTYYKGNFTHFPNSSQWVSFEDMWNNNVNSIQQACGWLNYGEDDSAEEVQDIYNAIQDRANASLVDHRLILAFILQESHGCVRIPHTTSSGGTENTGLMQAHDGHEYDPKHQEKSMLLMVQDGTQGTKKGNGVVQELNAYGNPYAAARAYNSGYIDNSGDLSAAAGATACYVSDLANRLTGWVKATSSCPGSGGG